ncbi:hypothetical protein [Alkalimonas sp.]|uniref:hypothetical protein n=1 Tax=Alkalimonas sp. TaxID=1872453 RepID=UPI00263A87E0|nr:hypothetical protein [Alkalimonas sp.]MCC5825044.1 hypothetical protein [Alkalimonas sp.]
MINIPEGFHEKCASALIHKTIRNMQDEKSTEELPFVQAVTQGLADICEGNTVTLNEAKQQLGVI